MIEENFNNMKVDKIHYKDIGKGKHFTYDSRTGKLRASYDVFWVDSDGKKLDNQKDIDKIIASGY